MTSFSYMSSISDNTVMVSRHYKYHINIILLNSSRDMYEKKTLSKIEIFGGEHSGIFEYASTTRSEYGELNWCFLLHAVANYNFKTLK